MKRNMPLLTENTSSRSYLRDYEGFLPCEHSPYHPDELVHHSNHSFLVAAKLGLPLPKASPEDLTPLHNPCSHLVEDVPRCGFPRLEIPLSFRYFLNCFTTGSVSAYLMRALKLGNLLMSSTSARKNRAVPEKRLLMGDKSSSSEGLCFPISFSRCALSWSRFSSRKKSSLIWSLRATS